MSTDPAHHADEEDRAVVYGWPALVEVVYERMCELPVTQEQLRAGLEAEMGRDVPLSLVVKNLAGQSWTFTLARAYVKVLGIDPAAAGLILLGDDLVG